MILTDTFPIITCLIKVVSEMDKAQRELFLSGNFNNTWRRLEETNKDSVAS